MFKKCTEVTCHFLFCCQIYIVKTVYSYQPVFCGEEGVHPGSSGPGDAAVDGTESPPHPVYENCTTGSVYVSPATGARAQYTAEND